MAQTTSCPGCGLGLPATPGLPTHPYIGSSGGCWARYGELLAREYESPAYFGVHQLTVDAYAVQHPGEPERRSIQSVALHLITLGMVVERGVDPRLGPAIHRRIAGTETFRWLEPPERRGRMTVLDVLAADSPDAHERLVRAWAVDVWEAWATHHPAVRAWIDRSLR
jgi:hypothetical protein